MQRDHPELTLSYPTESVAMEDVQGLIVLYDGRSGTVFLQSLLDGHEEVLMVPATVLMFFAEFWAKHRKENLECLMEEFCKNFVTLFDGRRDTTFCRLDQLGVHRDEFIDVDEKRFRQCLRDFLEGRVLDRKTFFLAVHFAYAFAKGEDLTKKKIVVHALHVPENTFAIRAFLEDFPKARFIYMTLHHHAAHASHYRHHLERQKTLFGRADDYPVMLGMYDHAFRGALALANGASLERIRVIRLEDLHRNRLDMMQKLSNWLGLRFDPCLLQSTFNGKLWWGLASGPVVNGFSQHVFSDQWKRNYYKTDIFTLEFLFQDRYRKYGYAPLFSYDRWYLRWLVPLAILLPTRWEVEGVCSLFKWKTHRQVISRLWAYYSKWVPRRIVPMGLFRFSLIAWALKRGRILTGYTSFLFGYFRYFSPRRLRMFYSYYGKVVSGQTVTFDLL